MSGDEAAYAAIVAELDEASDGEALTADGFDDALCGVVEGFCACGRRSVALYDYARCLEILTADGGDVGEAAEHMALNVLGTYAGPGTPMFAVFYRPPVVTEPGSF